MALPVSQPIYSQRLVYTSVPQHVYQTSAPTVQHMLNHTIPPPLSTVTSPATLGPLVSSAALPVISSQVLQPAAFATAPPSVQAQPANKTAIESSLGSMVQERKARSKKTNETCCC
eukprot:gb/GFBE01064427.1/.p1 GENE.gb/GFBE01064427.1/~~gb/GFBE01064427.1/.p1  ORF type:complete len:116 (+),score=13.51 gb/GFBE01064427.1/:1-348(+)